MKKKNSYRWLIWIFLAVILIGVALWNILPPYIDRWQSTKDYEKLAEEYVSVNPETKIRRGSRNEKKTSVVEPTDQLKSEFDQLKKENPDIIGWIRFDDQDELGINYPIVYSGENEKYLRKDIHGNEHIAGSILYGRTESVRFFRPL